MKMNTNYETHLNIAKAELRIKLTHMGACIKNLDS